ncbi:MAG: hypothetical protein Q9191_001797 [Dirinaria sp. TL-2023a]
MKYRLMRNRSSRPFLEYVILLVSGGRFISQPSRDMLKLTGLRYGLGKHVFENDEEATKNFLIVRSNVDPGLWSTSEAGVVVLSANLPSMNPIFKRLHPKSLSHAKYTPKDEESSHILEYLDLSGHKTERGVSASVQRTGLSTTAVHTVDNGKTASTLPDNGILVEMGLEQSVRSM